MTFMFFCTAVKYYSIVNNSEKLIFAFLVWWSSVGVDYKRFRVRLKVGAITEICFLIKITLAGFGKLPDWRSWPPVTYGLLKMQL